MRVRVLLFGPLKDDLGGGIIEIDVPEPATTSNLRESLAARFPVRAALLKVARVAVNHTIASSEQPIHSGDEVAIIELVSGG